MMKPKKLPYDERPDFQKVKAQWHKLTGLHGREEWSEAVVRAATAAEIAANFAIRQEFALSSNFDAPFVDGLLKWANGLSGKLDHLLIPLIGARMSDEQRSHMRSLARSVNDDRNKIVHRGEFRSAAASRQIIEHAREFIETLVRRYKSKYQLKEK
jgi:uncharacterized membrane protein